MEALCTSQKIQIEAKPNKCIFRVSHVKLLGFIISERGIEVDPSKAKAIIGMPTPRTEKDVCSFLGHIQYISHFIAQLTPICEPLLKLLRKNVPTQWNNSYQAAFDNMSKHEYIALILVISMALGFKPKKLLNMLCLGRCRFGEELEVTSPEMVEAVDMTDYLWGKDRC